MICSFPASGEVQDVAKTIRDNIERSHRHLPNPQGGRKSRSTDQVRKDFYITV